MRVGDAFGHVAPYRLGMEEELLLVDPSTLALRHHASDVVPRAEPDEGTVKFDVYEALAETSTPVVASAQDGAAVLERLRGSIRGAGP